MLGSNIRKKRKSENMTISALAKKAGVSDSYISQLERGLIDPSVSVLRKIAAAMNVPLSSFFDEEYEKPLITRLNDRTTICEQDQAYRIFRISPDDPELPLEMAEFHICPGAKIPVPAALHDFCLIVTDGCLDIQYEEAVSSLCVGDSIFIPKNTVCKLTAPDSARVSGLIIFSKGSDNP